MWTRNDRWFGEYDFDTEEEMTDDIDLTLASRGSLAREGMVGADGTVALYQTPEASPQRGPGHVAQKV